MTDGATSGATPSDGTEGLRRKDLTTREALNAAETDAISLAYNKYIFRGRRQKSRTAWLTDSFLRTVHVDMFGEIWDWAGKNRTISLNIGCEPHLIQDQLGALCGDFNFWNTQSAMETIEIGARLQHRLTKIHPFRNGNGRHARLMSDIYFRSAKHEIPQWPQVQLLEHGNVIRERYIAAMRDADKGDYGPLITFIKDCLKLIRSHS